MLEITSKLETGCGGGLVVLCKGTIDLSSLY
jgi:hypothetical protein